MLIKWESEIKAAVYILSGLSVAFFIIYGIAVKDPLSGFLWAAATGIGIWVLYRLIRRIVLTILLKNRVEKKRNR
ncbi:MAG: hypothetical protein ACLFST_05680 [Spirochaetia bacterium]